MRADARPAAVAGLFYASDAAVLAADVRQMLGGVQRYSRRPKAIIAPHAGFVYSGPVAASAYAGLEDVRSQIDRVVLLGPSHYVPFSGLAASTADAFETPLGSVEIDRSLRDRLLELPQVELLDAAHTREHSLEVQLPFLQIVLGSFRLVPLAVGEAAEEAVAEVVETVWEDERNLLVVSSDLSHYHDYRVAQRLDGETCRMIESFETSGLGPDRACGCRGVNGLLVAARRRQLDVRTLDLRNSGDTAGPRDRVVGYGAWLFSEPADRPRRGH